MIRSPLRLGLALAAMLLLSLVPVFSLPASAAPAQPARSHLSPPPPPPAHGKTYFYCNWLGSWIRLKHVPEVPVERFGDARVVGQCQSLRTNDKYYRKLVGRNINVFYAEKQYPGVFVVHNGRQGRQPVFGTWTFPIPGTASATLNGTVTDSTTGKPIPDATVSAQKCISKPTLHCTTHTDVTNANGKYTIQFFQFGKWKVTATAGGYATGGSVTVTVNSGKSSILNIALVRKPVDLTLSLGVASTPLTVGSSTAVTVTLSQPANDGTVTFASTGTASGSFSATTCTPAGGTCSVTWTPSSPGTATLTASWSGDNLYNPATNTANVTVNALTTTLTVSASPSPAKVGQTVTLTALLGTTANGGTVTFTGTGPSGSVFPTQTCVPAAGTCQVSWQASAPGTWTFTASWSGSGGYGPATGSTSLVVTSSTATMTLTANPSSPQTGQATTLTATLSVAASDGVITFTGTGPTGSSFTTQTCVPSSGSCHVTWTPTAAGNWTITATWSGDTQYPAGAQANTQVAVSSGSIAINLTATPNPAALNSTVTLKATLTQPVNDGSVLFTGTGPNSATFPQKSCVPTAGTCSVTWTANTAGQWQISAFWSGDSQYQPQVATIQVTVSSSATTISVTANPNPVRVSHPTQLTATLTTGASGGNITFSGVGPSNQTFSGLTCPAANGTCTVTWTPPANAAGTWTVTANWPGNSQFGAASGSVVVTVSPPGFLTVSETPNPLQVNHTGTITGTVQSAQSGQITFTASGPSGQGYSGSCQLTNTTSCTSQPNFTPTAIGTWTITAVFSNSSGTYTDTTIVNVVGTTTTLTLTSTPNPPTVNQSTTLTATLNPPVSDGTVTFSGSGPNGQSLVTSPQTCTPNNGVCVSTWSPPVAGNWTVTASWSGDASNAASSQTITVSVGSGHISITANPSPPSVGDTVTLTATLAFNASSGTTISWSGNGPQGEDITQGYLSSNTCAITQGSNHCSVTWSPDAGGDWNITATWSGDTQHPGGDSTTTTITVGGGLFSETVTPNPAPVNTDVVVTATLADTSESTGEVDIYLSSPDGQETLTETCQLTNGTCQSQPILVDQTGTWSVLAIWEGDPNNPQYQFGEQASGTFQVT